MKAIFTRHLGPTDTKSHRIVPDDHDGNRVVLSGDHATEREAAIALCNKMGWFGTLVEGGDARPGSSGNVYVFAYPDSMVTLAPTRQPDAAAS